jgi:putative transposase
MTKDRRMTGARLAQGVLLDPPAFERDFREGGAGVVGGGVEAEHVGAAHFERAENRKGHRNGHKPRVARTREGTLNLLAPRTGRAPSPRGSFRATGATRRLWGWTYVEGASTRKVRDITGKLYGTTFSKSLVSSLASGPYAELKAWRDRQLEAKAYPYLFVDARYEKVRTNRRVVSQGGARGLGREGGI